MVKRTKRKLSKVVEIWSPMYNNVTIIDSVQHFKLVEKVDLECFLCVQQNIIYQMMHTKLRSRGNLIMYMYKVIKLYF